ncbi:MAG: hypothetical protein ACRCSB_05145 [Bacteroidales bacterium]
MQWIIIFTIVASAFTYHFFPKARNKAFLIGGFFGIIFLTECFYPLLFSLFAFSLLQWIVINEMLFFSVMLGIKTHRNEILLEKEARKEQELQDKIDTLGEED